MEICVPEVTPGESAHLHTLAQTFITVSNSHVHAQMAVCVTFRLAVNALVNLHKVAEVHLSPLSLNNLISANLSCLLKVRFRCHK